jgi:hypothetical protein
VTVRSFDGTAQADSVTLSSLRGTQDVSLTADRIDRIVIQGGEDEAILVGLCLEDKTDRACYYSGKLLLDPNEELADWSTSLLAQTLNAVPIGEDPLVAATTIGGLPVTNNWVDAGETYNITYGSCNVQLASNGEFRVVADGRVAAPD